MNVKKICVSKNMKVYEQVLIQSQFLRVHDSYMVNMNFVEKYVRGEGGYVVLEDGTNIDVSKRRKQLLLDILQNTRRVSGY
jgi:two-component system LytT family response regulator